MTNLPMLPDRRPPASGRDGLRPQLVHHRGGGPCGDPKTCGCLSGLGSQPGQADHDRPGYEHHLRTGVEAHEVRLGEEAVALVRPYRHGEGRSVILARHDERSDEDVTPGTLMCGVEILLLGLVC